MKHSVQKLMITGCLLVGLGSGLHATAYHRDITQTGSSAEMIGIGSVKGFSNQAAVVLESPAGLGYADNSFSGFYTHYFGGTHYMAGAVSYRVSPEFIIGIGTASESNSNLDATGVNNDGEFTVEDQFGTRIAQQVVGFEFSPITTLHLGTSWIHYTSDLYEVTGTGTDVGFGIRYNLKAGDVLLNGKNILGHSILFSDDSKEKLAAEWTLGFKSNPLPVLNSEYFAQVSKVDGVGTMMQSIGVKFYPLSSKMLAASLGYRRYPVVSKVKDTITAGLVLNMGSVSLAYSYDTTDVYKAGQQHYVSLGFKY